jgi:hypothetical protein
MKQHWKFWAGFVSLMIGSAGILFFAWLLIFEEKAGDPSLLFGILWFLMLARACQLDCIDLAKKKEYEKNV